MKYAHEESDMSDEYNDHEEVRATLEAIDGRKRLALSQRLKSQ